MHIHCSTCIVHVHHPLYTGTYCLNVDSVPLTLHTSPLHCTSVPRLHHVLCLCSPESIKSPVTDIHVEFSAIDPLFSKEEAVATDSSNRLSVARPMAPTPSLENVANLRDYVDVSRSISQDSSESDKGFNDGEEKMANKSQDSLASHDSSIGSARARRERYHASWHPSIGKRQESDNQSERSRTDSLMSRNLKMKKRLIDIKGGSDSDTNLMSRKGKTWSQGGSERLSFSTSELPTCDEGKKEEVRRRHVYKATGKSCERGREGGREGK